MDFISHLFSSSAENQTWDGRIFSEVVRKGDCGISWWIGPLQDLGTDGRRLCSGKIFLHLLREWSYCIQRWKIISRNGNNLLSDKLSVLVLHWHKLLIWYCFIQMVLCLTLEVHLFVFRPNIAPGKFVSHCTIVYCSHISYKVQCNVILCRVVLITCSSIMELNADSLMFAANYQ